MSTTEKEEPPKDTKKETAPEKVEDTVLLLKNLMLIKLQINFLMMSK